MTAAVRCAVALCFVAACSGEDDPDDPPVVSTEQQKDIPFTGLAQLDVLFVIDTSPSMADLQASLATNYERFGWVFETIETGGGRCPPSLRIGVTSADLGAGPHDVAGCTASGDGGALQATARVPGCIPPDGSFIRRDTDANGQLQTNYTGGLPDVLPCIAALGADGCSFQQPLEAMRRALQSNAGFRRDDAYLLAVLIADEDDCSVADPALFDPALSAIGPLSTFRCFEDGVACDPDAPRTPGVKTGCAPRTDAAYIEPVDRYVDDLRGRAPDALVAVVAGNAEPVEVVTDGDGDPALAPSCASAAGAATPAIRLDAFAAQFPQRNTLTSICNEDVSDAIGAFFTGIIDVGVPCLDGKLVDTDGAQPGVQPHCSVTEVIVAPGAPESATVLPACDNPADPASSGNLPCFATPVDPLNCLDTPTQLSFERYPICSVGSGHLEIRCLAE